MYEAFSSAAKSCEDNLFARMSSVNDAFTQHDALSRADFQSLDDRDGRRDYEQRRYENYETGSGRADAKVTEGLRYTQEQIPRRGRVFGQRRVPV